MKQIGIQRLWRAERRNITSLNTARASFVVVEPDHADVPDTLARQFPVSSMLKIYSAMPKRDIEVDCHHFFNSIPLNGVPFVCTFETSLPRWYGADADAWQFGYDVLASDPCRRLFAMSGNARDLMSDTLARLPAGQQQQILAKIEVAYPPQSLPESQNEAKFERDGPLRIAFVGGDFLRKGGLELVQAVSALIERGYDLQLDLVTNLKPLAEDWPWNVDADQRIETAKDIFARHATAMTLHGQMENASVLSLFSQSDVAVLPSFHDTFGFAVLEAQSRLCPVITTNQRSFPEINDSASGWTVSLPVDGLNQASYRREDFAQLSECLRDGLQTTIAAIVEAGRPAIRAKAERALERLRCQHDPEQIGAQIFRWYSLST